MLVQVWLFVATIATGATAHVMCRDDPTGAVIASLAVLIASPIAAFGALGLEVVTQTGSIVTVSTTAAAILFGANAALSPAYLYWAVLERQKTTGDPTAPTGGDLDDILS